MGRRSIFTILIISIFMVLPQRMSSQNTVEGDRDFYTQIANMGQGSVTLRPMDSIGEMKLPTDKKISWSHSQKYAFKQLPKITSKQEMLKELKKIQDKYAPFLRDLAPKMQTTRSEFRIEKMQFRYETDADRSDFNVLLRGEGEWKEVKMPYYHGPQGPSTAWYRAEINIPEKMFQNPSLMLHFNGADYYTDAFINGHHIGYHEGMLDEFEFNMRKYAKPGKNIILVKVRNDYSMLGGEGNPRRWGNKLSASNSAGWDDPFSGWSCCPTGYGIYQDVYVVSKGAPYIADVFCRPLLEQKAVELWVEIDLEDGEMANEFLLKYSIYGQNFQSTLIKNRTKIIKVEGGRVLNKTLIEIPDSLYRLWTPEEPWLYQMQVTLATSDGCRILDTRKQQFGMRSFEWSTKGELKGRMYLNGEEIRLRGTNTMGFLQLSVMNHDWDRLRDDLLLAKLTNMNFIRTTQRIMPKEVYEYADRLGMMMQADLPLFAYINQKQYTEIIKQASGIERVLRNHPSVILLSYLNESMAEIKPHAISRYAYERLFNALDIVVRNENPDRAVKYVDGDYQAPSDGYPDNHCYNIWYDEHCISLKKMCRGSWISFSKGWMYGCGEFGAEGLDPADLMKRRYPAEWLKKEADGSWSPKYMHGLYSGEQTYGKHWDWFETEYTMEDWVKASHEHQKWGVSKVARAFRRMPRMNSFAVHLFIDAWPNSWMKAIMDCERTPKKAWFAYRDALTPLSVQVESERFAFYSGEEYPFQLWICNDTHQVDDCSIYYQLEQNGRILNTGRTEAEVPTIKDAVAFQGFLPVKMPEVQERAKMIVRAAIYSKTKKQYVHEEAVEILVFPRLSKLRKRFCVIGNSADSKHLIETMKPSKLIQMDDVVAGDLIVLAQPPTLNQYVAVEKAVRNGAKVLVLKRALENDLLQNKLTYELKIKEGDRWVLFRNRSHEWIQGTDKRDLFYGYSSKEKAPSRFVFQSFIAPDVRAILYQKDCIVIGEKKDGAGQWILCGLAVEGMLDTNPALKQIFHQMMK